MDISICKRNNLCVDCDDNKCWHCGDKVSDCPRYPQTCKIRQQIDSCDECTWIDSYIEKVRKELNGS